MGRDLGLCGFLVNRIKTHSLSCFKKQSEIQTYPKRWWLHTPIWHQHFLPSQLLSPAPLPLPGAALSFHLPAEQHIQLPPDLVRRKYTVSLSAWRSFILARSTGSRVTWRRHRPSAGMWEEKANPFLAPCNQHRLYGRGMSPDKEDASHKAGAGLDQLVHQTQCKAAG